MKFIINRHLTVLLAGCVFQSVATAADVVPLTFINSLPFATVKIGATASRLMIDSGGSLGISIPEQTIRDAGSVQLLEQTTKFRDLGGQVYEVQNLVARQVTVGKTELGPVEGRIHVQWGGAPEGQDAALTKARQAGAIDLAAFGKRSVMFDYRRGSLSVYEPGEGPQAGQPGWQELRLESGRIGPHITLTVNGKPLRFVLDTGAQINLVNAKRLAAAATDSTCQTAPAGSQSCDPGELGTVQDGNGRSPGKLTAQRIDLNGAPFDGILGAPFFQSRQVLFDLTGNRLLIAPADVEDTAISAIRVKSEK